MDSLTTQVIALSTSSGDLTQLLGALRTSEQLLNNNRAHIPAALVALDFSQHSLGVLFLL